MNSYNMYPSDWRRDTADDARNPSDVYREGRNNVNGFCAGNTVPQVAVSECLVIEQPDEPVIGPSWQDFHRLISMKGDVDE